MPIITKEDIIMPIITKEKEEVPDFDKEVLHLQTVSTNKVDCNLEVTGIFHYHNGDELLLQVDYEITDGQFKGTFFSKRFKEI